MTASSPRGTFSRPELAAETGDNPLYHPADAGARRYHPGMPGEYERLPAAASAPAPGVGPAVLAAELLGRMRAELPLIGGWGSGRSRSWWPRG